MYKRQAITYYKADSRQAEAKAVAAAVKARALSLIHISTGDPDICAAFDRERAVNNEACKYIEFIRFEQRDMMLGTVIHPKNRILPLLRGHFCSRLPDEDFMIFQ